MEDSKKSFTCKTSGCGINFTKEDHLQLHEKKHEMNLSLGLGQKSGNIFAADQTPTPTRLIKNCEEVGLFDDLRHVNPFDETFRRAVEQKNTQSALASQNDLNSASHDSLHTPQVFPVIENIESGIPCQQLPTTPAKAISVPVNAPHVQSITETCKVPKMLPMILPKQSGKQQQQTTIQLIQPQVITLKFPPPVICTIPVQTVKPYLLPKSNVEISISGTPPSALPIKERLKAMLSLNSKRTLQENSHVALSKNKKEKRKSSFEDDFMQRRRAAAERYRIKIKKEHIDLRKRNTELATENAHLKEVIKQLKTSLSKHQSCCASGKDNNPLANKDPSEIQIPPSTVRLVMNIPKLIIQPTGQTLMQNPVTFAVEKH